MQLMGLMLVCQKPNTSKAAGGHKICPYLLSGLRVERPNQVWCADITYLLPRQIASQSLDGQWMRRGFLDLVINTDQASQFPFFVWTDRLRRSLKCECAYCTPEAQDQRPRLGSGNGSSSTTTSARIQALAVNHLLWSIGREMRQTTPISRNKEQLNLRQKLSNK
jgi:hypothetical protein